MCCRMMMMMILVVMRICLLVLLRMMMSLKRHLRRLNQARRDLLNPQLKLQSLLKRQKQLLLKKLMVRRSVVIQRLHILPRRVQRLLQLVSNLSRSPQNLVVHSLARSAARLSALKLVFSPTQRPSMLAISDWAITTFAAVA